MKQLSMTMSLDNVKPYPLYPDYYFRNLCPEDEKDIASWADICSHGLDNNYSRCILEVPEIDPGTDVFFACDRQSHKPVGTVCAYVNSEGMGRIHMVGLLPEVRGRKIGHAIVAKALEKLVLDGAREASLTTDDFRRPAIRIYLTAGFVPVMEPDDSPDAIPMEQRWQIIMSEM